MSRITPFESRAEVDNYLSGESVQCLECMRWFRHLGRHLSAHGIHPDTYRARWGIPAGRGLVGSGIRSDLKERTLALHSSGALSAKYAAAASAVAAKKSRGSRVKWERAEQSARTAKNRPGDTQMLPPGSRLANGENADRRREYQRAYRATLAGNALAMDAYRSKWSNAK